jgi:hypothetical protein
LPVFPSTVCHSLDTLPYDYQSHTKAESLKPTMEIEKDQQNKHDCTKTHEESLGDSEPLPDQIIIPLAIPTQEKGAEICNISQYKSVRDLGKVKAKCFRADKEKETAVIGLGGAVLRVYGFIADEVYVKAKHLQKKQKESPSASFDVWVRLGDWGYSQRCYDNTEVSVCEETQN